MLTSEEIEVLKYIFDTILKTEKPPTIREMQLTLEKSDDYIIHTLDELEKKDILLRKGGTQEIVSIYPLSNPHRTSDNPGKWEKTVCNVRS